LQKLSDPGSEDISFYFFISREESMLFFTRKAHSLPPFVQREGRRQNYPKSALERYRKPVAWTLFAIIFATVILSPSPEERNHLFEYLEILSYLLVAVATMGRLWCGIYIFGRKNDRLCQDGPYSICRNPLYLFSFMGGAGIAMTSNRIVLTIAFVAISCSYYFLVVMSEEKRLLHFYGQEYEKYCTKTPRFMPNFRNYWSREQMEINPQVIFHAIIKNMWFFWLLFALEIIKALKRILA
jgi:protein-S-isoprenylcysteine O-methyltransferase Ste14